MKTILGIILIWGTSCLGQNLVHPGDEITAPGEYTWAGGTDLLWHTGSYGIYIDDVDSVEIVFNADREIRFSDDVIFLGIGPNADHITIRNLNLANRYPYEIYGKDIRFVDCQISGPGAGDYYADAWGAKDLVFENCWLSGQFLFTNCTDVRIDSCDLWSVRIDADSTTNMTVTNSEFKSIGGVSMLVMRNGCDSTVFTSCTFNGDAEELPNALKIEGDHFYVVDNVFNHCALGFIFLGSGGVATNNEFHGCGAGIFSYNFKDTEISNNLFSNHGDGAGLVLTPYPDTTKGFNNEGCYGCGNVFEIESPHTDSGFVDGNYIHKNGELNFVGIHSDSLGTACGSDPSGVAEDVSVADDLDLAQNYPNPFNPTTTIGFTMPRVGHAQLIVYDMLGRQVAVLVNEVRTAGQHTVSFDGANLPSGVYFYQIRVSDFVQTKKMLLAK